MTSYSYSYCLPFSYIKVATDPEHIFTVQDFTAYTYVPSLLSRIEALEGTVASLVERVEKLEFDQPDDTPDKSSNI